MRLGDFDLTIVSDGTYFLDGGAVFGIIPKVLWEKKRKPDGQNRLRVGLNCVLVRTGKKTVLIETGIGNKLNERQRRIYDPQLKLMDQLRAIGVAPEQVDVVINSHLHFDHCGWNTVLRDGKPVATFPNATYYGSAGELRDGRLQRERDRVSYLSENYDPLVESGQMKLHQRDAEILPGISARAYPGHTRDMLGIILQSRGETACYISDLIPTISHIDLVWGLGFDLYPLETIESKKRYYAESIPGKWLTIFTHDHETPCAYIERDNAGKLATRLPDGDGR